MRKLFAVTFKEGEDSFSLRAGLFCTDQDFCGIGLMFAQEFTRLLALKEFGLSDRMELPAPGRTFRVISIYSLSATALHSRVPEPIPDVFRPMWGFTHPRQVTESEITDKLHLHIEKKLQHAHTKHKTTV